MALFLLCLVACAAPQVQWPSKHHTELTSVPFFPQTRYHCGPAALATVLTHSGATTDAVSLADDVYLPGRRGSLQIEMIAATRGQGRIPFLVGTSPEALLLELKEGHPVLVLQNLGVTAVPIWHYAVVVGYDAKRARLILRSGTEERQELSARRFFDSWRRANYWGLVVLPPSALPASADPVAVVEELLRSSPFLHRDIVDSAWSAALARWPDHDMVLFGAANHSRVDGDARQAAARYRRLVKLYPGHVPGLNNLADLLMAEGCLTGARRAIEAAIANQSFAPEFRVIVNDTSRELESAFARSRSEGQATCHLDSNSR